MKDIDLQAVRSGLVSRRNLLHMFASVGVVATGQALSPPAQAAGEQPLFLTWATMDVPDFFGTYIAKNGAPPRFAVFGDQDEAILKVRNGFKSDVVYPESYSIRRWYDAGLLEPVDTSKLSHWGDIFETLRTTDGVAIDGSTYWVPVDWGLSSLIVREDLVPQSSASESWSLLWDESLKGRLAVLDSMADAVGAAALHVGVDAYAMSDADREKVRQALLAQRPLLRFYSNDPTTMQQALTSGEVVAANSWNDAYVALKAQGVPVRYLRPKEGVMAWVGGLSIVKGSKYKDLAHELIDAYLDPQARAFSMRQYGYGSATRGGFAAIDDATLTKIDLPRDPVALLSKSVIQRPMKEQDKVQSMFEQVKQGL